MFPAGDVEEMVRLVSELLAADDELVEMSARALVNARRFSWPAIVDAYDALAEQLGA